MQKEKSYIRYLKCCSVRAVGVMSLREFTRMVTYETKELLFEAALEIVERLTVARCRAEGRAATGRMGIIFLTADPFTGQAALQWLYASVSL